MNQAGCYKRPTLSLLSAALFFFNVFAASAGAAEFAIDSGHEEEIALYLELTDIEGVNAKPKEIRLEKRRIEAIYQLSRPDCRAPLILLFTHRKTCEESPLDSFCLRLKSPTCAPGALKKAIISALARKETPDLWKKITSPKKERKAPQASQPSKPKPEALTLQTEKLLLFAFALFSVIALLPLIVLRLKSIYRQSGKKPFLILAFWFLFAGLIRLLFVRPTVANAYSILSPEDYLQAFPFHGLTFPFMEEIALLLFGQTAHAIFFFTTLVGALSVGVFYALAKALTKQKPIAHLAALLLALTPLHVRLSTTDSEHIFTLFFFFMALLAWLDWRAKENRLSLFIAVSAGILMLQSRPEAVFLPLAFLAFWPIKGKRKAWTWAALLFIGVFTLLSVCVYLDRGAFTSLDTQSSDESSVARAVKRLPSLFLVMPGTPFFIDKGHFHEHERATYRQNILTGSITDALGGENERQTHSTIFWQAPVLLPFYLAGLILALLSVKTYGRLLLAMVFLRLPVLVFAPSVVLLMGPGFHSARYHIATVALGLLLASLGIVSLWKWLGRKSWGKKLAPLLFAAIALHFLLTLPHAYRMRYLYQDESDFLLANLDRIEQGATIAYLDPEMGFIEQFELELHLYESIFRLQRPDIKVRFVEKSNIISQLKESDYYFECAVCSISQGEINANEKALPRGDAWKESFHSVRQACEFIKENMKFHLLGEMRVRPISYTGQFQIEKKRVPIRLYSISRSESHGTPNY